MATSLDVCKQALASIGSRTTIVSLTDGSPEATYCSLLYAPLRDFLLREGDYDFALKRLPATPAGVQVIPWVYSYNYPDDAIRIRQLIPTTYSALDPRPIEWNLYNVSNTRYIVSKQSIDSILYTFAADVDAMDSIFRESLVRLLGSALAFALTNRIEASDKELKEAMTFAGIANLRDS